MPSNDDDTYNTPTSAGVGPTAGTTSSEPGSEYLIGPPLLSPGGGPIHR
jgi:hypothetical protein